MSADYIRSTYAGAVIELHDLPGECGTICRDCLVKRVEGMEGRRLDDWINDHAYSFDRDELYDAIKDDDQPYERCQVCESQVYELTQGGGYGSSVPAGVTEIEIC